MAAAIKNGEGEVDLETGLPPYLSARASNNLPGVCLCSSIHFLEYTHQNYNPDLQHQARRLPRRFSTRLSHKQFQSGREQMNASSPSNQSTLSSRARLSARKSTDSFTRMGG